MRTRVTNWGARTQRWQAVCWVATWLSAITAKGIEIPFIGPEQTHLTCQYQALANYAELRLEAEQNGGTRLLAQASGEAPAIAGNWQDGGLEPGNWTYRIRQREFSAETQTWGDWHTVQSATAQVDGKSAKGRLLFSESLNGAQLNGITVPAGLSLALEGELTGPTNNVAAVFVEGTITTKGETVLRPLIRMPLEADIPVSIDLRAANTLAGITGGRFSILTAGCNLSGCQNIEVKPYKGATLSGITNGTLDLSCLPLGETLSATDSTLASGEGYLYGQGYKNTVYAGALNLVRVTWRNDIQVTAAGNIQGQDCNFESTVKIGDYNRPSGDTKSFRATNSRFKNLYVDRALANNVNLTDCLIAGTVSIFGGAPTFMRCEFGDTVRFQDRNNAQIQYCRFLDELEFYNTSNFSHTHSDVPRWHEAGALSPLIANNAFMGDTALRYSWLYGEGAFPPTLIPIGPNYYGSPRGGYDDPEGKERGYLPKSYGGRIKGNTLNGEVKAFAVGAPLNQSPLTGKRSDIRVFPKFWLNGHIVGQNTIGHTDATLATSNRRVLLKERDSLLSLDLSCTEENLRGVRIYAEWDGQEIEALPLSELRRDPASFSPGLIRNARTTVNIILPGVNAASMPVTVYLDTSKVTGYDPETYPVEDQSILSGTVQFKTTPARPLVIWVMPVTVEGITGSWGAGNTGSTVAALERDIPDKLPLPGNLLRVEQRPQLTVWSSTTFLTSLGMLNRVSTSLAIGRWMADDQAGGPDFIVAVMPNGLITTGAEGASFMGRRRVIFVDENRPQAALHELGHGIGLWTEEEQYAAYPPDGAPVHRASLFRTETGGGLDRIQHLAGPENSWYDGQLVHYDIMGAVEPSCPLEGSVNAFDQWFRENLVIAPPPQPTKKPAEATQRILVAGVTGNHYQFRPETITMFNVTGTGTPAIAPGVGSAYRFQALDQNGSVIYSQTFLPTANNAEWTATFDLPGNTTSCRITDTFNNTTAKTLTGCGLISAELLAPATGSSIGQTLQASWRVQTAQEPAPGQLLHCLYYRLSPTNAWQLLVGPTSATNLNTSSAVLPDTQTLSLKLISSDGIKAVEAIVDGLRVNPRAPLIVITAPQNGEIGQTNAIWKLEAEVTDFTPEKPSTGTWTSSLQGRLGQNRSLLTELIEGEHRLRFEAAASNGLTNAAELTVRVQPTLNSTDLGLIASDLTLCTPVSDPNGLVPAYIVKNATNRFDLRLRNGGAEATARLRLYLRQPGSAEALFATHNVEIAPFATEHYSVAFLADQDGVYAIRAVLDQVNPPDTNPLNNEREWTWSSVTPRITLTANPGVCGVVLGDGLYLEGASVTVSAIPQPDYNFVSWTEADVVVSTNAEYNFTATTNRSLTANFQGSTANISLSCAPGDGGTVSGAGAYAIGATATMTAVPNSGYQFVNWAERDADWNFVQVSTNPSYTFTVAGDRMLRANFRLAGGPEPQVSIEEALDNMALVFSTNATSPWLGLTNVSGATGGDAVRSGLITDDQESWLQTTVTGPGQLTFRWKASTEADYDMGSWLIDGVEQQSISGLTGWLEVTSSIENGTHTIRWKYVKDSSFKEEEDCVWLDKVTFTAATNNSTTTTPVAVPHSWLNQYPSLLAAAGNNPETAAWSDLDQDGMASWQEYVAGSNPTNKSSVFRSGVTLSNGTPRTSWTPDLGTARTYSVEGKASLEEAWGVSNANSKFFRVKANIK